MLKTLNTGNVKSLIQLDNLKWTENLQAGQTKFLPKKS